MASKHDDTIAALNALGAPYNSGSLPDRQRKFLLAKTGKTSGTIADLQVAAGMPVRFLIPSNLVVLP